MEKKRMEIVFYWSTKGNSREKIVEENGKRNFKPDPPRYFIIRTDNLFSDR